jgi:hypothetical protein
MVVIQALGLVKMHSMATDSRTPATWLQFLVKPVKRRSFKLIVAASAGLLGVAAIYFDAWLRSFGHPLYVRSLAVAGFAVAGAVVVSTCLFWVEKTPRNSRRS